MVQGYTYSDNEIEISGREKATKWLYTGCLSVWWVGASGPQRAGIFVACKNTMEKEE